LSRCRHVRAFILAATLVLGAGPFVSSAAVAGAPASPAEWDALVRAAKGEGKVEVILSGQMPQKLRRALPAFEKKYGVKVNFHTGGGRKHNERVLAERRFGRYTVDAWIGGSSGALLSLIPIGALAPLDPLLVAPEVVDTSLWYRGRHHYSDPDGKFVFTWGASPSYSVAINTKLVRPEEIRSYASLLDPRWKGRIVSFNPAYGSAASSVPLYLNPKIGEDWFRRWAREMNVTIVNDARQGAEWLAIGRFAIGMFGIETQTHRLAQEGFPVRSWLPYPMAEGEILSASAANIMVLDRAPNPGAMKLFVNWALSRDAQQAFIDAGETTDSLRKDVDNRRIEEQYRIRADVNYYVAFDDPEHIRRKGEVIERLKHIMLEAGHR
jgi:iron(III) transport system substrate-binding protein